MPLWVKSAGLTPRRPLPVYPNQRTLSDRPSWSVWCQERTMHGGKNASLLDHLIGGRQQCRRHGEAKRFRRLEVDDQFELRRLFNRHVGRRRTAEDLVHLVCCASKQVQIVRAV